MKNSIYKMNEKEGKFDIGFFSHIKYQNKNIPVLITNYQKIYLSKNDSIKVRINNETKIIEFGKTKYFNELYDLSIIEIKENKNNKLYFLELDENIYEKDSEINYNNNQIYIIHYAYYKTIYATFGKIKDINYSKLLYRCKSNLNLKDFPIINLSNNKLIGISKEKINFPIKAFFSNLLLMNLLIIIYI